MSKTSERSAWSLAGFACPQVPLAALGLPLVVYLPEYYANDLRLPLGAVGLAFALVRVFDIGVDPLVGALMDRTRTRWGRYRPWLAVSAPILMLGIWLLFMATPGVSVAYLLTSLLVVYVGFSIGVVGHFSWASTLSNTYDGRSRSYAWVQGMAVVGILVALALPAGLAVTAHVDSAGGVHAMAWLALILTPLSFGLSFISAGEPAAIRPQAPARLRDYLDLLKNRAVLRLLATDQSLQVAAQITGALFFFYFMQVKLFSKGEAGVLLLGYFLGGLIGASLWVKLAHHIGKHKALAVAAVVYTVTQACALFTPAANLAFGMMVMFIAGLPYSASGVLIRSMLADVGDEQRLATGADRTSLFYALLIGESKLASAAAVVLTFPLLALIGFHASSDTPNTASSLNGLRALFAFAPGALGLLAAWIILYYPLTAERHAEVRAQLADRDALDPTTAANRDLT